MTNDGEAESIELEVAVSSLKGSIFLFAGNLAATIIGAITSILIARLLGPDGYGLYTLVLTPASFLLLFSGFGVGAAAVKYISEARRRRDYNTIMGVLSTILNLGLRGSRGKLLTQLGLGHFIMFSIMSGSLTLTFSITL